MSQAMVENREMSALYAGVAAVLILIPCAAWSIQNPSTTPPVWFFPLLIAGAAVGAYGLFLRYSPIRREGT